MDRRGTVFATLVSATLVALVALAGCKRHRPEDVAFTRRESLPGFEIALPASEPLRSHKTPAAGEILVRKDGAIVMVSWQVGRVGKDDLPAYAQATINVLGAAVGATTVDRQELALPAPNYGVQMIFPTDKHVFLAMSVIQCAHSNVTLSLATMASADRARAVTFHQRFVATHRCREDGAALTTTVGLAAFDQGDTIAYLPASDPPTYVGVAGQRWYVTPGPPSQRKAFEQPDALKQMFKGLGLEVVDQTRVPYAGAADWLQFHLTIVDAGKRGEVLVGSLDCSADQSYLVITFNPDALDQHLDPKDLERVTCPTAAVDPDRQPSVTAVLGAACDRGLGPACAAFARLIAEEPARLAGHDPAKLRARACELGVAAACP